MRSRLTGLVAVLACWSTLAWAGVPNTLHYSGKLDTNTGAFTGSVDMKFALYAGAGAKSGFWTETQAVAVQDGRFHVHLGSKTALSPSALDVADLHLGVTVGNDAEMDRVKMGSVPYAMRSSEAANAATVGGQAASSFAASAHTHDYAGSGHSHGYAPLSHTHNYAASSHSHNYAPTHSHPYVNTGGGTLTGNLSLSGNKVTSLAAPTANGDAATKAYVDAASGSSGGWAGYTPWDMGGSFGGLKQANIYCNSAYSGSHWASADEIAKLGSSYPWTHPVWIRGATMAAFAYRDSGGNSIIRTSLSGGKFIDNNAVAGYFAGYCSGWTVSNVNARGPVLTTQGTVEFDTCNSSRRLPCVY